MPTIVFSKDTFPFPEATIIMLTKSIKNMNIKPRACGVVLLHFSDQGKRKC